MRKRKERQSKCSQADVPLADHDDLFQTELCPWDTSVNTPISHYDINAPFDSSNIYGPTVHKQPNDTAFLSVIFFIAKRQNCQE
jgi:hypothetical protein